MDSPGTKTQAGLEMNRNEILKVVRDRYVQSRLQQIEPEFIEYEEEMITDKDLETILTLASSSRGNPHNSAILYVTGISDQYNTDRPVDTIGGSPPDIDVDFDTIDFHKIMDWLINHYGREQIANIMAVQKFKLRSALNKYFMVTAPARKEFEDQALYDKAMKKHEALCSEIHAKLPPPLFGKEPTLEEAVKGNKDKGIAGCPELATDPRYAGWYSTATKLENMISAFSIHAAGVVISNEPISNVIPLWTRKEKGEDEARWVTQFTMSEVESLGLLKCDFLRIDNLSIIKETIRLIKERHGIDLDPYKIEDGDKKSYRLLSTGYVAGIFQMEASRSAKSLLKQIKPANLNELSDLSSLNRPGPMQAGMTSSYIQQKSDGYAPYDMPPVLADILKDTYWCLVYQEQLMALINRIAGFSLKETDKIRRAIGKKDEKKLKPYRQAFIDGCIANNVDSDYAIHYWDKIILGLADYMFNKSHSLAYSYVTYICAWLKANYPAEFFTALMSVRSRTLQTSKWAVKAPDYVREARHFNINVSFPDVNKSEIDFTIQNDSIYFGLPSIAKIGVSAAEVLLAARQNKPFSSVKDFLSRVDRSKINTGIFNQLVIAGAFDSLGYNREELLEHKDTLYEYFNVLKERERRIMENVIREQENVDLAGLITTRNEIRAKTKKKSYIATPEELEVLEATKGLTLRKPLALPEQMEFPQLTRSKRVSVTSDQIMEQGTAIGCFIIHPATIVYPETTRISDIDDVSNYEVAGVIDEIKTYKNANGTRSYVTISDGTGSLRLPLYDKLAPSKGKLIKAKIRGGYPNSIDDDAEIRVYTVNKITVYGE